MILIYFLSSSFFFRISFKIKIRKYKIPLEPTSSYFVLEHCTWFTITCWKCSLFGKVERVCRIFYVIWIGFNQGVGRVAHRQSVSFRASFALRRPAERKMKPIKLWGPPGGQDGASANLQILPVLTNVVPNAVRTQISVPRSRFGRC
jgi:hypothetical protein